MTAAPRIPLVPLGLSLSAFFVVTYVLCILFGLLVSTKGMHQLLPMLMPGFTWITWPSFLIGLAWSLVYGWYVTVVFAPIYNFCTARFGAKQGTGHA